MSGAVEVCALMSQTDHRSYSFARIFAVAAPITLVAAVATAQTLAGGLNHSVILKSDGTVWSVGADNYGQLGDDSTAATKKSPVQVSGLTGVVAVAAGENHSMAITSTGALYLWGRNDYGQIGDASTTDRKTPVQSNLTNIVKIAAGGDFSAAVNSSGQLFVWGRDNKGQLGDGSPGTTNTTSPGSALTSSVATIAAGKEFLLLVKTDGTVYGTGENSDYQLGDGSTTDRSSLVQMSGVSTATAAAAGEKFSVILLSGGSLKAIGYNGYGQLGDGTNTQRSAVVSVASVSNIAAIAAGLDHVVARESDNTVWTWGRNTSGQLGNDDAPTEASSPVELTSLSSIASIGAGHTHSLAVSSSGIVFTWGENGNYQLGDGTNDDRAVPTPISDSGFDWKVSTPTFNVAAGQYNVNKTVTITITTSGATIRYTQNGNEPTESDSSIASGSSVTVSTSQTLKAKAFKSGMPSSNTTSAVYELKVVAVSITPANNTYTTSQSMAMSTSTADATIRYTYSNDPSVSPSTPTESSTAYSSALSIATYTQATAVAFKSGWTSSDPVTRTLSFNYGTVSTPTADNGAGSYVDTVTVALSSSLSGAVIRYTLNNTAVQSSSTIYTGPLSRDITTTLRFKAFHKDYSTASSEVNNTYTLSPAAPSFSPTAGSYVAGQLVTVTGTTTGSVLHYTINGIEPTESDPVITSGSTLTVGNYSLKAKAWKTNTTASTTTTAAYTVTGDVTPPALAAGSDHSLAIRNDGVAWAWGANTSGQIGDGTTITPRSIPKIVTGLTGTVAATGGNDHSHVLRLNGTLVGFGLNSSGRLGDGTTTSQSMPVALGSISAVVAVDDGADHSIALIGDGSVYSWGANGLGQIGDGTTTSRTSPTLLSLTTVAAVSANYRYSLALKQNGTAWSWGSNSDGQLGNGTTTSSSSPVQVSGLTTVTKISAGRQHALALLSDGTVRSWGDNAVGSLGDGTTTDSSSAVEVAGLEDIVAIAAGSAFSVALDDQGRVWTWGGNGDGELGDGTTIDRSSAAQVSGLPTIVQIAAGDHHVLALSDDETVFAWGRNAEGQLGDGTTTDRYTPVAISGTGMNWRVATPILSLASGLFYTNQSVTVTIGDPDATLRYTTNGADPTSTSSTVSSGGSISIDNSQTVKVSGWKTGAPTSVVVARAYELKAVAPTMTPGAGAYGSSQSVSISSTTSGTTIRYTTDGSEPSESSSIYSSALAVASTQTVKAGAYKTGWTASDSGHASYAISGGTVATPTISPTGGAHATPPTVSITTTTSGASIRYTLDGTTPSLSSPVYVHPFRVLVTTTVKAKAFKSGFTASAEASTTYGVDAAGTTATPAIVPAGGRFAIKQTVTISGASGATLRYTTDGTDPTTSSTSITSGNTIAVDKSMIVKVRAWATGSDPSAVRRADFLITGAISAGDGHNTAVTANGDLLTWGGDVFGQLANGTTTGVVYVATQVLTNVAAAAAGQTHTVIAKTDGTLWGAGDATSGKLGQGSTAGIIQTPAQVSGFTGAIAVAAGRSHTLVLKSDGTVWAYGLNSAGQLGDGTTTNRSAPVQVIGLTGITAIAASYESSYALQTDGGGSGVVWSWGGNTDGSLGDGSTLSRLSPTRVIGIDDAIAIAAPGTGRFAVALRSTGQVMAWGYNADAQLGDGTQTTRLAPVPVSVLTSGRVISAGESYALAVDAVAHTWAWGDKSNVIQVGGGGTNNLIAPVPERSDYSDVLLLASGTLHTLTGVADGTVRAAGANGGRLGNGSTTSTDAIVTVTDLVLADNAWLIGDADGDDFDTWREYLRGTDPLDPDSNGNGVPDGVEQGGGGDPTNPDSDGDGVINWTELVNGTDPFRADTDGDSVSDLNDVYPLDPTRSLPPSSNPSDTTPPVVTLKEPVTAQLIPPI